MNYWLLASGILVVGFVLTDLVLTTFAPTGSGLMSGGLRRWIWQLFLWLSGRNGYKSILNYAGPISIVIWLLVWLFLIWAGNALIVLSDPDSVVSSANMRSTTIVEKIYFTGFTLSTLGSGEFIPFGGGWQIYSAVISFSGFMLITISLTYLYSVITNDINRRKVSLKLYHTGSTPQEILLRFWDGESFGRLKSDLYTLSEEVMSVVQNHMAYPVLHNFHSTRREESLPINLVCLDEALTILLLYKPKEVQPSLPELYQLRSAITFYLQTLRNVFISPSDQDPPPPNMGPLLANNLPLHGKPFDELLNDSLRLRRKLLCGLLHSQGWEWKVVEHYSSKDPLDNWLSTMRKQRLYPWPSPHQNTEKEEKEQVRKED